MTRRLRVRPALATVMTAVTTLLLIPGTPAHPALADDTAQAEKTTPTTIDEAADEAARTGQPVTVDAYTTSDSTLAANPDGTFGFTQSVQPVRKWINGDWKDLDATLRRNSDGSVSTTVSNSSLTFGRKGSTRLATQGAGADSIGIDLPFALPEPQISENTATYRDVIDDVDLVVTADELGGFSEVFVVHNAEAAENPLWDDLTLDVTSSSVTVAKDGDNITLETADGTAVETLPAPQMWDSAAPDSDEITTAADPETGTLYNVESGLPAESTVLAPSEDASIADLGADVADDVITLAPDRDMLTSDDTVWPVYIDPSFTEPNFIKNRTSWATVRSDYPSTVYLNTTDALRVGYQGWDSPNFKARSFVRFTLPSYYHGADVVASAKVTLQETYAPSCSARNVQLWYTSTIVDSSSKPTWNNQPTWYDGDTSDSDKDPIDTVSAAHGYNTSCAKENVAFASTLLTRLLTTASANNYTGINFGLRASDETDKYGWKKFSHASSLTTLHVVYDHKPNTPTTSVMKTSPATELSTSTTCKSSPTGQTVLGYNDVSFSVKGSDPDGTSHKLGYKFQVYKTSANELIASTSYTNTNYIFTPGVWVTYLVDKDTLAKYAKDATGAAAITDFYWRVILWDGYKESSPSPSCHFKFDTTIPGAPTVTEPATTPTIGVTSSFSVTAADASNPPAGYQYSLNGAAAKLVLADTSGNATVPVIPTRLHENQLMVVPYSAGGNMGGAKQTRNKSFGANPPAAVRDGDFNSDNVADVLTVGTASAAPAPGLWFSAGTGSTGALATAAINIGTEGNGSTDTGSAADFTGAQVIMGTFTGGRSHGAVQDALIYYPATGAAAILPGNGDGTLETVTPESVSTISKISDPMVNDTGYLVTQLANAGKTSGLTADDDGGADFPDLFGIASPNGTTQALYLLPAMNLATYDKLLPLTNITPAGGTDWTNWRIFSAQSDAGGTALFLWNTSTKTLYLWTGLATTYDEDADSYTITGSQYTISTNWNPVSPNTIQAANLNSDTITDLRVTRTTGTATAYLVTGLPAATALGTSGTSTATLTAQNTQTLTW